MKNYLVKKSQYKPLEGKIVGLETIKDSNDPYVRWSELNIALKKSENRMISYIDNKFDELKTIIINKK